MADETGPMQGGESGPSAAPTGACLVRIHVAPDSGHQGMPADVAPVCALGGDTLIGREPPRGGLRIAQHAVSRVHARITYTDGLWVIADLESRNGTVLNGRAIDQATLEDGDVIRIGDVLFRFARDEAEGYVAFGGEGPPRTGIVGGFRIQRIASELARVAPSILPVLVLGETGTGKELAARLVHDASRRPGPFCALNAAAVPSTLLESELFGYKRGAFTGALQDRLGLVRAASGGTLLLDEVGDMPMEAQAKLLRVIETREVVPLGGSTPEKVDVRLVCATHRDVRQMVESGRFRADLYARINGYVVTLPPLRERKEDIVPLVRHFLAGAGRGDLRPSFQFVVALCQYGWPFNVRELEMAVRRAAAVVDGPELPPECLPQEVRAKMDGYGTRASPAGAPFQARAQSMLPPPPSVPLDPGTAPSPEMLRELAASHNGNLSAIARALDRDRALVHRWMQRAAIDLSAFRNR
jgi:DNA-binding NtrC family response regulator